MAYYLIILAKITNVRKVLHTLSLIFTFPGGAPILRLDASVNLILPLVYPS